MQSREESGYFIEAEKRERIKSFFDLTEQERENLLQRVVQSRGIVRLVVHPFFDVYNTRHSPGRVYDLEEDPRTDFARIGLDRILKKINSAPPVFVLEEAERIKETSRTLVNMLGGDPESKGSPVYLIPSFSSSAEPFISNPVDLYRRGTLTEVYKKKLQQRHDYNWKELAERLKTFGVTKVIVGGMHFIVSEDDLYSSQCVGDAIDSLRPHFQIQISHFTSPSHRGNMQGVQKSRFQGDL
ncbi:MAG: hypothetical protein AAB410_03845 [Patescibacteria group bacterium]